jgi:festuclavine dehydrogenase
MTILLTGGTGKTSSRIAQLLLDSSKAHPSHKPLIVSRSASKVAEPFQGIAFDWLNDKTWEEPFSVAAAHNNPIQAIYLVAPSNRAQSLRIAVMTSFVDFASTKHHVKRFVLMTATDTGPGGNEPGLLQDHIAGLGLEFCTLRPTWFMGKYYYTPIIYS